MVIVDLESMESESGIDFMGIGIGIDKFRNLPIPSFFENIEMQEFRNCYTLTLPTVLF